MYSRNILSHIRALNSEAVPNNKHHSEQRVASSLRKLPDGNEAHDGKQRMAG